MSSWASLLGKGRAVARGREALPHGGSHPGPPLRTAALPEDGETLGVSLAGQKRVEVWEEGSPQPGEASPHPVLGSEALSAPWTGHWQTLWDTRSQAPASEAGTPCVPGELAPAQLLEAQPRAHLPAKVTQEGGPVSSSGRAHRGAGRRQEPCRPEVTVATPGRSAGQPRCPLPDRRGLLAKALPRPPRPTGNVPGQYRPIVGARTTDDLLR